MKEQFHEINDNIKISFKVPEILFYLMEDAEKADKCNDGSYDNLTDTIDVFCKNFYADGKITQEQWNIIISRYPQ